MEVAKSRELGYVPGAYEMTIKAAIGKMIDDEGKCSADMFSSDFRRSRLRILKTQRSSSS